LATTQGDVQGGWKFHHPQFFQPMVILAAFIFSRVSRHRLHNFLNIFVEAEWDNKQHTPLCSFYSLHLQHTRTTTTMGERKEKGKHIRWTAAEVDDLVTIYTKSRELPRHWEVITDELNKRWPCTEKDSEESQGQEGFASREASTSFRQPH
jgi:hypothetical protein